MQMEADWEVEIGAGAPILDAIWPGFVDLRRGKDRIGEIDEAQRLPALAKALLKLNGLDSDTESGAVESGRDLIIWTSKSDLWVLDPNRNEYHSDEMDAAPEESVVGLACYIDMLPREGVDFGGLERVETWVRAKVSRLRQMAVRSCRADLVIRRAVIGDEDSLGVTAYVTACGATLQVAEEALGLALAALAKTIDEPARNQPATR
jgi:hypothetical protein